MIFNRKYIFETKRTRFIRYVLNSFVIFSVVVISYFTFIFYIPFFAELEKKTAAAEFFQKAPDAIVVFTGDHGRIRYALELIKKWPEAQLLISGVYEKNTFKTLVSGREDAEALLTSPLNVDIDYESKNTIENVKQTLMHLNALERKVNNILVISSDYHIYRIHYLFNKLNKDPSVAIYYDSIKSDWRDFSKIKKVFLESLKFMKVWFVLDT